MTQQPMRPAASEAFLHASQMVATHGWAPCSPNGPSLHLTAHLRAAAEKIAPAYQQRPDDLRALMGYLLVTSLQICDLFGWEDEPERTADDVQAALAAVATPAP